MLKETISKQTTEVNGLCPFIQMSFDDCYIAEWDNKYTFSVIYYCLCSFNECEIYIKNMKGEYKGK